MATKKIGVWRLSNKRFTIRVDTDDKGNILNAAPIASCFIGKHFDEVCHWMQRIGITDITLLRRK
jgi:transcription elongation GreA/GreB family factor